MKEQKNIHLFVGFTRNSTGTDVQGIKCVSFIITVTRSGGVTS